MYKLLFDTVARYGDSLDNTVEKSSIFSLFRMHCLPSARAYGQ